MKRPKRPNTDALVKGATIATAAINDIQATINLDEFKDAAFAARDLGNCFLRLSDRAFALANDLDEQERHNAAATADSPC